MTSAFKSHHGTKSGWNDWKPYKKHPLGTHTCALERFCKRKTFPELVARRRARFFILFFQMFDECVDIDALQNIIYSFRAYGRTEHGAVFYSIEVVRRFVEYYSFLNRIYLAFRFLRLLFKFGFYFRIRRRFGFLLELLFKLLQEPYALLFLH